MAQDPPNTPKQAANFNLASNQKNASSVGLMTAISGIFGGLFFEFAQQHHLEISKEVAIIVAGFFIGYAMEGARDVWRYLGWPLFRDWYRKRFGKEPDGN